MKEQDIRNREAFDQYLALVKKDVEKYFSDKTSLVLINCPACGSNNQQSEFEKNSFTYVSCEQCNTLFVNPRPSFGALIDYYTESDSTNFWVNSFFKPVAEARREKIFAPRAEHISKTFQKKANGIIGDIGAGFGIFLEELIKVWPFAEIYGIEPSTEQVAICKAKGQKTICSALEDITGRDNYFDLLTSFEVFEHLYDPGDFLKHVYNLLKPGGCFYMTTLNGEGFDIQIMWDKSKSINPPQHLNFFNPSSIEILFSDCGFKDIDVSTPGKLDWDILEGMIENEVDVRLDRFWSLLAKKGTEKSKVELQRWISTNNYSSHMRVMAIK